MAVYRRSQALWDHGRAALALTLLAALFGCGTGTAEQPDNKRICGAYAGHLTDGEVIANGVVREVLGMRRGPNGDHEGFLLQLDGDCDLLLRVETNTDITGQIPISGGQRVTVKGVYVFNAMGGLIHWTHHDPAGRHVNGYVKIGDRLYQ